MNTIIEQMRTDENFAHNLKSCEEWPDHAYMYRPHGLVSALFMLADIARGEKIPSELELRKACALVYADHLRLENHFYYSEEAKQGMAKKAMDELRDAMKRKLEAREKP